jgi:hypothetical protein
MFGFINATELCEASHFQEICISLFSSVSVEYYWMCDDILVTTNRYILENDVHIVL